MTDQNEKYGNNAIDKLLFNSVLSWRRSDEIPAVLAAVEQRLEAGEPVFASLGMHADYPGTDVYRVKAISIMPCEEYDDLDNEQVDRQIVVTLWNDYTFTVFTFIGWECGVDTLFWMPKKFVTV